MQSRREPPGSGLAAQEEHALLCKNLLHRGVVRHLDIATPHPDQDVVANRAERRGHRVAEEDLSPVADLHFADLRPADRGGRAVRRHLRRQEPLALPERLDEPALFPVKGVGSPAVLWLLISWRRGLGRVFLRWLRRRGLFGFTTHRVVPPCW